MPLIYRKPRDTMWLARWCLVIAIIAIPVTITACSFSGGKLGPVVVDPIDIKPQPKDQDRVQP